MSKRRKASKRRPKLYIDQPDLKPPTPNMQEDYQSPIHHSKDTATATSDRPIKRQKVKKEEKNVTQQSNVEHTEIDENTSTAEQLIKVESEEVRDEMLTNDHPSVGTSNESMEKVPFSAMSIIEQIDYLASSRNFMPKLKCEVITNDNERFRGVISDRKNDTVFIETFKRPKYHQISSESVKSIRLLGF